MIESFKTNLNKISIATFGTEKLRACVEAGHIYTDEAPTLSHETGAMVGAKVCRILEGMGVQVQRMLFVDDFNASSHDLDLDEYKKLLTKHGFTPEKLVLESSLEKDALGIIAQLERKSVTEVNKNGSLVLKKDHKKEKEIVLRKSQSRGFAPACAVLDSALYLKKHEEAGICVTILPDDWRAQQKAVKKILQILGKEIPIFEVYFTNDGEIDVDFDY